MLALRYIDLVLLALALPVFVILIAWRSAEWTRRTDRHQHVGLRQRASIGEPPGGFLQSHACPGVA